MTINFKKIILIILALLGITILLIYLLKPLKLTQISPKDGDKNIGIDAQLQLTFNKRVSAKNFSIESNPSTKISFTAKANILTVTPSENLEKNQTYAFTLKSTRKFVALNKQKNNQHTWQFTTGSGIMEEIEDTNLEDFFSQHPLARSLPYEAGHFSIDWPNEEGIYTIILLAPFNAGVNAPPIEEQEKTYKETLKNYKQEALDWIKSKGVDPSELKINWDPAEAGQ